jgi:aconitate hydratase
MRLQNIARCRRLSPKLYTNTARHHYHNSTLHTPISNLEPHPALPYPKLQNKLRQLRRRLSRPLTLSEKVLYTHLQSPLEQDFERGKSFLLLDPDRAACHDATATMAMLQFVSAGLERVKLPTSIHCDHLIVAEKGAVGDLERARAEYEEVCLRGDVGVRVIDC